MTVCQWWNPLQYTCTCILASYSNCIQAFWDRTDGLFRWFQRKLYKSYVKKRCIQNHLIAKLANNRLITLHKEVRQHDNWPMIFAHAQYTCKLFPVIQFSYYSLYTMIRVQQPDPDSLLKFHSKWCSNVHFAAWHFVIVTFHIIPTSNWQDINIAEDSHLAIWTVACVQQGKNEYLFFWATFQPCLPAWK